MGVTDWLLVICVVVAIGVLKFSITSVKRTKARNKF